MNLSTRFLVAWGVASMGVHAQPGLAGESPVASRSFVFIGTYTGPHSAGIYRCGFDAATGTLTPPDLAAEVRSPSFLARHPTRPVLYAVSEQGVPGEPGGGRVSAYAMDLATGALTLLNRASSGGEGPCHVEVDATGNGVLVANYGSGSVALLGLRADGALEGEPQVFTHTGAGVSPSRQKHPHAHAVVMDRANRFMLAADLGIDKVMAYRLDGDARRLTPTAQAALELTPGHGPRHLLFDARGRTAYIINELGNTVTVASYEAAQGRLTPLQDVTTLPAGFTGESATAELQLSPSGRFLYASNRGHDSIAGYAVDPERGTLTPLAIMPCGGKGPRHFMLDPSGRWMLVGNERSGTVTRFRVDPATGLCESAGAAVAVPSPVCLLLVPRVSAKAIREAN